MGNLIVQGNVIIDPDSPVRWMSVPGNVISNVGPDYILAPGDTYVYGDLRVQSLVMDNGVLCYYE